MKMNRLPVLVVAAILLAAVLVPAMGMINNSDSSFNLNANLNGTTNPDPETPCPSPSIESTANSMDTEANQTVTMNEFVDVVYDSTPKPVIIMFKDKSDTNLVKQHGGKIKSAYRLKSALAASLPQKAIDNLRKNPKIEFIVDDLQIFTMGETLDWGVDRIDADVIHEYNKGAGVKVAIMDTGIDYNHPDLAANYKGGYDFGGEYSGAPNDADPMDYSGHGTHCAGIVAAVKGNEIGVIGVAPETDLYAVKVFTDNDNGSYSDVVEALEWCIDTRTDGDPDNDIQVISMSFGSKYSDEDPGIESWINAAFDAGILLVGAAGNEDSGDDTVIYPARYENVIAVAATDSSDNRAYFSNTGPDVELAAPGMSIYSTYLSDVYAAMSGTSMACPMVSGTAALVWNAYPDYTNTEVRQRLQVTVEDLGATGKDNEFGYGLVDAEKAAVDTTPPASVKDLKSSAVGGTWINWTWNDPEDADFSHVILHLNGVWNTNVSKGLGFYSVNSLEPDTSYELGAQTVDTAGNINETWVNQTVETSGESGFLPRGAGDPTEALYAENLTSGNIINNEGNAYGAANGSTATVTDFNNDAENVEATIQNTSQTSNTFYSLEFSIRLKFPSDDDKFNIQYWDSGDLNWYTVATWVGAGTENLTWFGNYSATNIGSWPEVNAFKIKIICDKVGGPDNKDLNIDAFHVYVNYTDSQAPQYSNIIQDPPGNPVYGQDVQCNTTWTDNTQVDTILFRSNYTGTWENYIPDSTGDEYYYTIPASDLTGGEIVGWNFRANDTSNNWNDTMPVQVFEVQKAPTEVNLLLNGTDGDKTYSYSDVANFTVTVNVNGKTVELWTNLTGTDQLWNSGDTPLINVTTLDYSIGVYNITGIFPGDENYSSSSETHFLTIVDTAEPQWSDAETNKTTIYENDYVKFTTNWIDNAGLAGYIFSINQTGTWENSTFVSFSGTSGVSENTTQITATAGTTVEWRFYAKDTSDNRNVTDIRSFVVSSSSPPPPLSSPYIIYGWMFYKNGTACDNPVVNITNLNNSNQWQAETNASYNYYQITLASGTDLNTSEILQFSVKAPGGSQSNTIDHTVTQVEINNGGLFDFNITLEAPVTPFVINGWVNYSNGATCDNPTVNITNTNTSMQWQAKTHSGYNFYKLVLDSTKINAGDVLEFNATDGTEYNTTTHTVTTGDTDNGGVFDFNLTLPSAPPTEGPAVDSITITPDDDSSTSGVQVNPNPGGAKTVTVTVVVSDPNGYDDISTVNITDIAPDPAHGDPSPVTLSYQSGSGSGTTATYNGTFDMQFYDAPIEYTVTVVAKDAGGLSGTGSSTFNYTSCNAMSLDAATIAFGSIDPGENNTVAGDEDMGTTGSPTVRNTGNVEIDVNITGSDMTSGSDTITKDHIDVQGGALGYLDLSVARCFDANMTAGASSLENVDFRLNVPYGISAGSYTGSVTLTADTY